MSWEEKCIPALLDQRVFLSPQHFSRFETAFYVINISLPKAYVNALYLPHGTRNTLKFLWTPCTQPPNGAIVILP